MADVIVKEKGCDQTTVEVYTCPPSTINIGGGGGGDGAFYSGENVGSGSGVYKETDDLVDPRLHKFKSLIAGDNIVITPGADDILISSLSTVGAGEVVPGFAAGQLSGGCGATTSFYPSVFGGLAQGDFMLWAVVTDFNPSGAPSMVPPTGWDVLWRSAYFANQYRHFSFYYKRVDAIDLDPGTQHTISRYAGQTNTLCSTVFVYKNIHTALPFAGGVGAFALARNQCPHIPIFLPRSPCLAGWQTNTAGAFPGVGQYGPAIDHEATHTIGGWSWYLGQWVSDDTEDENWIAGESLLSSGQGAGWTYNSLVVTRSGTYDGRMDPGSGVSRHYMEYSVELSAGQIYMFAFCTKSQWQAGDQGQMTISYVDPSSNERLMHYYGTGSERNSGACTRKDPLADYGTTWVSRVHTISEDGVPSVTGHAPCLEFTALTTGTHKLRIGISSSAEGEICGAGNTNRRFSGIIFRRGRYPYRRVHTPSGAVYNGTGRKAAHGPSFTSGISGGAPGVVFGVALNSTADALPRARLHTGCGAAGDLDFAISDDGLTIYDYRPTTDDYVAWARADRPVMPTINSVPQKYYMEWSVLDAGTQVDVGFDYPFNSSGLNDEGGSYTGYYWLGTGSFGTPVANIGGPDSGTATNALGDVLGMAANFVDKTIRFYKNGALIKTIAMIDNYGAGGLAGISAMMPLWAFGRCSVSGGSDTPGSIRANMAGPFAYPVAGYTPYDYAGSVSVTPISEVGTVGTGYPVLAGTPEAPLIKSIADGDGIAIDDDGVTLNVRIAKAEVPLVIPTTSVRGAAWSNAVTIIPAEAKAVSVVCPHNGVITSYTVMADAVGSAVIDVRKSSFAGLPAGSGARICGTNKPTLSSASKTQDVALTSWSTSVTAGDVLTFVLESCVGLSLLSVQLTIQEVIP